MLTSLLPGFRHLRTPFALGALCAFQMWILIGEYIPSRSEAQGFTERIYSLGDVAGRGAVTAAISFLLYLVGDIVSISPNQMMRILEKLRLPALAPHRFSVISAQSRYELNEFASRAFSGRGNASSDDVSLLAQKMVMEFAEIRMRLIATHLDVYLEHDRYDSEADFRTNVGFYSTTLWPIVALYWTPWFIIGVFASAALFAIGLKARRDANAILVQVIVSGIVESRYYVEESSRDHSPSVGNVTIRRQTSTR
ncbi:hypothetical protein [Streptomyces cellostaticus]|uniref:hypothetical protein n=1 Tax=Streptomyces cellostaticus TaxID=67285 RepID=UPI0020267DCA|nr:hypothetical protein [Streptomyces cellostaticus]